MDRRHFLVGIAASMAATAARAAAAPVDDIEILERAYRTLHPGLYRYSTFDDVTRRFARLRADFAHAGTLAQRYRALSLFLATIRCGHTYANFYNQPKATRDALFAGRNRLPFHFRWIDDRMVVTRSQSAEARLVAGTEILRIDGRVPARVLAAMLPYTRADGHNDDARRALLEVQGHDRYESFDIYYPLQFEVAGSFELMARQPGHRRAFAVSVEPIDLQARRAGATAAASAGPAWTLSERDGAAILTMPTWSLYDSDWDWRGFLDAAFDRIRQARGLIIDLRGNEGGLDCGHEIIARLIDSELALRGDERRVRFRRTPPDLDAYLDTWDDSFRSLGADARDLGDGFFRLPAESAVTSILPKPPRVRTPLIVLVDAHNSSATFQFAQLVQTLHLGRLVGMPTGGNQRGINGGSFFFLKLPASGLEADLPLIGRFPTVPMPDAGLTPDLRIEPRLADIPAGRDAVLETALRVL